jgi:hypothetical protein
MRRQARPQGVAGPYVELAPGGDILEFLREQGQRLVQRLWTLSEDDAQFRYAPGKWTIRDVVRHVVDSEWVFTVRALTFARAAGQMLPGMDPDTFAEGAQLASGTLADALREFQALRTASTALFMTFDGEIWERTGVASGNRFTVRSMPFIIAGHCAHHEGVLEERYLAGR